MRMKIRKSRILAILLAVTVGVACLWGSARVSQGASDASEEGSGWTIMLYLCGTDLETDGGYASINLEEICNADLPEDVNFVIEMGGTQQWQWDGIDPSVLSRCHVEDGSLYLDETQPSASMGEVSTLVDFVNWGVKNYPSSHYGVIFWDHGGGSVDGVCYDQLYDNDNLDMPELAQAMSQMPVKLDLIGFDACLMASFECAKALQQGGKYMVASEETEPGYGWDYTTILDSLGEDTSMNGEELGKIICDAFYQKCDDYGLADTATLSVIDLSKVGAINDAFNSYAGGMALATQDMQAFGSVAGRAERAESFGGNTPEEGYCNLVDLTDLVENTRDSVNGEDDGTALIDSIRDAVRYEVHGDGRSNANGLAIYYPLEVDDGIINYYNSFSDNVPYLQYIAALAGNYSSIDWDQEYDTYEDEYEDYDEEYEDSDDYYDEEYEDSDEEYEEDSDGDDGDGFWFW